MLKPATTLISMFALLAVNLYGQLPATPIVKPSFEAVRISEPPSIDGVLDDEAWKYSNIATGFKQFDPVYMAEPSNKTVVRLVYDNSAIYVSAMMYDSQPDSIRRQLGQRDNASIDADWFYACFDTYNARQDSYYFGVTASGVQREVREVDLTFNTVWQSAVSMHDSGWIAEMRIPYSALRFPAAEIQTWGLQFFRVISRYNEEIQWSIRDKSSDYLLNYWGTLTGLSNINPPPRISAVPYLTLGMQGNSAEKSTDYSYSGGMDVKWGLNESFTLDMILMPDFSQVQTDNTIKNLSAFEVQYDEKRPFFNEGTDLFKRGDLFYSRRIGRTPLLHRSVGDSLRSGESIVNNPLNAKLLNAVKISGRNNNGLGIGFFNAITGNTRATVKDSLGNEREIITDPFTNYNIMVAHKAMKNNSWFYVTNANVIRPVGWRRSNVTAMGLRLADKSSTYQVFGDITLSNIMDPGKNNKPGVAFNFDIQKVKGKLRFVLAQNGVFKNFNNNDLGYTKITDLNERWGEVVYTEYQPKGIFRSYTQALGYMSQSSFTTGKNIISFMKYTSLATFTNYWDTRFEYFYIPFDRHDYYEARRDGSVFILPGFHEIKFFLKSDTRKMISLDSELEIGDAFDNNFWEEYRVASLLRFSDRFNLKPEIRLDYYYNVKGWVSTDANAINFGNRDTETFTYSLAGEYMFNNKLSLNLWMRQYRSKGNYDAFYTLNNDGSLTANPGYTKNHNFNYNSFNIDLVLGWEFSPGSMLNIVWKNAIEEEDAIYNRPYLENLDKLMNAPKANSVSVKLLYYLDYQMIRRRRG